MLDKLSDLLRAVDRVPTTLLVVLVTSATVILFIPEEIAGTLAVDDFRKSYRIYLGPGLILIGAWLLSRVFVALASPLRERRNLRRLQRGLATLTGEERGYLAQFIETGRTTIHVPVEDGIVGSLVARRILYRASNVFDVLEGVPYNMQPWAREYLAQNPDLLSDAVGAPLSPRERRRRERF